MSSISEGLTKEVFIPKSDSKDHIIVEFLHHDSWEDALVVGYKDKEYKLHWINQYSYYVGNIDGIDGYIL